MKKKTNKREDVLISVLVDVLCEKYNLPECVKGDIIEISKKSYIQGSNDCHEAVVKWSERTNGSFHIEMPFPGVSPIVTIIKNRQ
jgi:hypothetical protein